MKIDFKQLSTYESMLRSQHNHIALETLQYMINCIISKNADSDIMLCKKTLKDLDILIGEENTNSKQLNS